MNAVREKSGSPTGPRNPAFPGPDRGQFDQILTGFKQSPVIGCAVTAGPARTDHQHRRPRVGLAHLRRDVAQRVSIGGLFSMTTTLRSTPRSLALATTFCSPATSTEGAATPSTATSAFTLSMQVSNCVDTGSPTALHTSTGIQVGACRFVTIPDRTAPVDGR